MTFLSVGALLSLLVLPSVAFGQALPGLIRDDALKNLKDCDPPERAVPRNAVTTADFNGDGKPDYIIEYTCRTFCGTAGCTNDIWVSRDNTWTKEFSSNIRGIEKTITRQGRSILLIDLHGSSCGRVGMEPCPRQLRWDGQKLRVERR